MATVEQFLKNGMWKDSEISLQPENTYNDALNMRLLSNDNNIFSLESVKGNADVFSAISGRFNPNYQVIGWTTSPDKIVVFSTNGPSINNEIITSLNIPPNSSTNLDGTFVDGNGEIGIITFSGDSNSAIYTPVYNSRDLNFSTSFQIEARLFPENSKIERVYWVEKHNPPRSLNIADPNLHISKSRSDVISPFSNGQSFMVLSGKVTVNGIPYGPNEISGTIFTFNTGDIVLTFPSGTLVIQNFPAVASIDIIPKKELGNISFDHIGSTGELLVGMYQYAYQLQTSDGAFSTWSYLTTLSPNVPPFAGDTILSYQLYGGSASTTSTTKSNFIKIDGVDTSYFKIRVAVIRYSALDIADLPYVFFDQEITGASMIVEHKGGDSIEVLTFDDLRQILIQFISVQTLEIQKNRLFFGNVQTAAPFDFDPSTNNGTIVNTIEYLVPSDLVGYPSPIKISASGLDGHGRRQTNISQSIFHDQWYQVNGGNLIYNGVLYGTSSPNGRYFQGVYNNSTISSHDSTTTVTAVIRIQKYTGNYEVHPIEDDWTDTKGTSVSTFLRSYWRGEKYRFGVLVWDKLGNPTFVKWIDDKQMPQQYETQEPDSGADLNFKSFNDISGGGNPVHDARLLNMYPDNQASLRHIGISINNLDLKQISDSLNVNVSDLDKYIDGFSIVRAPRDPQIYSQGIMYQTLVNGNNVFPAVSAPTSSNQFTNRKPSTYTIYAPDFLFAYKGRPAFQAGDLVNVVEYRDDSYGHSHSSSFGTEEVPAIGTPNIFYQQWYYEKYYNSVATPSGAKSKGLNPSIIETAASFGVGGSGTYGDGAFVFENAGASTLGAIQSNATGASTLLIKTNDDNVISDFAKAIVNFIRPNQNVYGGQSNAALANTQYIYCGHYQKMDADFMTYLISNNGIVDNIEVFGGDCYIGIFDIARMMENLGQPGVVNYVSMGLLFPVESDMNIFLRQSSDRHYSKDGSYIAGLNANGISINPSQPETFSYNAVFSSEESNIKYAAQPIDFIPNDKFGYRVYYSNKKINGEAIDSFKIFLPNNFIDVEGWAGNIINLRSKDGKLFYWQNHAFGYIPVNERITLSGGGGLGTPTTIGEGGVATRYDELKKYYGNQHQWGLCETENSFVWFDARRKAFCHADMGGGIIELSTIKGLTSFFTNNVHGNVITYDNPVNGKGIVAVYDSRFREVIMVFKGIGSSPSLDFTPPDTNFTIGFNNLYKYFSGIYSFVPPMMIEFNNRFLSTFEGFASIIFPLQHYNVGDIVRNINSTVSNLNDDNYINILAYTTPLVPIQPQLDPTHWRKINSSSDLYMHNIGDIGKFYGVAYDSSVRLVINANRNIPKTHDNHLFLGMDNGFFFTDYIANNQLQTASDLGIVVSTRGEYQEYYSGIYSTIPQSDTGRLISNWIQVQLRKDNKLNGSITTSSNELIKFVSLQTSFRKAV